MPTDAQTLIDLVATQGYEKLSRRELIECILAAAQGGSGSSTVQDMQLAWTPTSMNLGEKFSYYLATQAGPSSLSFSGSKSEGGFSFTTVSGLNTLSFPDLTSIGGATWAPFVVLDCDDLTSISAPAVASIQDGVSITGNAALVSVDLSSLTSGGTQELQIFTNPLLSSLTLTSLSTVSKSLYLINNPSLTSLDLPALTTVGQDFTMQNCTLLASVNVPQFVPTDGFIVSFASCALNAASVNQILARVVANAGYVSGGVFLNLGTNAAPTGQGIIDKATLNARQAGLAVTN